MELQLVMETSSESLGSSVWLTSSLSPTYQQILPGDDITDQQTSLDYEGTQNNVWQSKQISPKGSPENHHHQHHDHPPSSSPLSSCSQSPEYKLLISQTNLQEQQSQALKRYSDESHQHQHEVNEPERKVLRKNGGNGSLGWSTQVEELAEHLAVDYDGSLSALAASHLATAVASYNMSEALLALPSLTVFKQEAPSPENQHNQILNHVSQKTSTDSLANNGNNSLVEADSINSGRNPTNLHQLIYSSSDDYSSNSTCGNHVSSSQQGNEFNEKCCFQYVLAAATSIATKVNEETLTYLNQGQSYEIKLKKLGDLSTFRGKLLKSTIRICFHERRLQYTEREQILAWQQARPGERLLEVDVPLSYGMIDVCQPSSSYNSVDFTWNPNKEIGCCIKINCISTEFTPKKHGGEKGVPFRIQVETRLPSGTQLHAASCKIKVFKLKGADRKHKQDRDKIQRRPPHEQDKYQPSYDCTILSDIPLDTLTTSNSVNQNVESPCTLTDSISPQSQGTSGSSSPVSVPPVALSSNAGTAPIISTSESNQENVEVAPTLSLPPTILPQQTYSEINVKSSQAELPANANAAQTCSWLRAHHFHAFESTFTSFSAADILRLSRDDLIQICGLADGIRLFNALHARAPQPKLSLYFAMETGGGAAGLWRAIYLKSLTSASLTSKLLDTLGFSRDRLHSVLILGPQGIHVLVTNELIANMKDESMFVVETIKEPITDRYKLLLKPSSH